MFSKNPTSRASSLSRERRGDRQAGSLSQSELLCHSRMDSPVNTHSTASISEGERQRNEWYPRGIQISLHIRSPGLQDYDGGGGEHGRGYSGVDFGVLKSEVFRNGGYSGVNFGHLKNLKFSEMGGGGVFQSKLWSSQIWSFLKWGVFQSKLSSSQIWSFPKWEGGLSGLKFQKEAFWKIWTKIYCSARNLLVDHR